MRKLFPSVSTNFTTSSRAVSAMAIFSVTVGAQSLVAHSRDEPWQARIAQNTPAQSGKTAPVKKEPEKAAAPAATPAAGGAPAVDAWAVKCSNQASGVFACEMVQAIVDGGSRTIVMLISISKPGQPGLPAVLFRAVHGVYLPSGLTVNVDGKKPTKLEYQKSDGSGVYAAWPLSNEIVTDLKRGTELVLEAEMNKDQKLTLKAPLRGFGAAFDRVVSTN